MKKYLLALTNLEIFTSIKNPTVWGRRKGGGGKFYTFPI